jgi:hypothetical protein
LMKAALHRASELLGPGSPRLAPLRPG